MRDDDDQGSEGNRESELAGDCRIDRRPAVKDDPVAEEDRDQPENQARPGSTRPGEDQRRDAEAGRELAEGKDQPDAETGGEEHRDGLDPPPAGWEAHAGSLGSIGAAHWETSPISVE